MAGRIENQFFWLLLVVGIIFFIITIYIAFANRGSEYSYQVLKPILGGIGVSILLWTTMLLSSPDSYTRTTDILILTKMSRQVVPLEELTMPKYGVNIYSGYQKLVSQGEKYWNSPRGQEDRANPPENEMLQYKDLTEYLIELTEWSTLAWIAFAYPGHWQMEHEWFDAISPGYGTASIKSTADPRNIMKFNVSEILPNNRFANFYRNQEPRHNPLLLPKGSSIEFAQLSDCHHAIFINTKYSKIKVEFESDFGGMIGITDLAEAIKKKYGPAWNQWVKVSFSITPKRLYQWSKNSQIEQQWIKELSKFYDDSFSWNHLKKKLGDSLNIQTHMKGFLSNRVNEEK